MHRFSYPLMIVGLTDRLAREGEVHSSDLFNLLGHSLQILSQFKGDAGLPFFRLHFLLRLLLQQGVLGQEEWMIPFSKKTLQDHFQLSKELPDFCNDFYLDRLLEVEKTMKTYTH